MTQAAAPMGSVPAARHAGVVVVDGRRRAREQRGRGRAYRTLFMTLRRLVVGRGWRSGSTKATSR